MQIPLNQIKRDTSRFQFRSSPFVEDRVQWLVENWENAKVDPLDVWEHGGDRFLLSGHHRYEAMLRLQYGKCECRVHTFSLEEAQMFALASNANRLEYSTYEYSRCINFLISVQKRSFTDAANSMSIKVGIAKKYYALRHLIGSSWEENDEALDLTSRAFLIGEFCETRKMTSLEIESLYKIVTTNDLSLSQTRQLIRDIKRQLEKQRIKAADGGSLFDMSEFSSGVVRAVKERDFLNTCSAQSWWLYELLQRSEEHEFPPELKEAFMAALIQFYSYCVGSEEPVTPVRSTGKGRNLKKALDQKAS
jgi:ParB-like nuclease domain